jgi:hypothetical protein
MRGAYDSRQTGVLVNIDRRHQIEPQQGQISQVVASKFFATQVGMDTTQAAKPIAGDPHAFEVGQFNSSRVAYNHVFDVTLSIDQGAYLSIGFVRQFA